MKNFFQIIILLCVFNTLSAQEFTVKDSLKIESKDTITDFSVDDFGNVYYIRNFSELNKIEARTQIKKSFSNQTALENLNTQNILQITVKSNLFNLIILDNQLNPFQDAIRFPIENNFSPTLLTLVDNNFLWGYDPVLQRLILWNYQQNKILRQSVILSEKTGDEFYSDLIFKKDKIYLVGTTKILVFDDYANLKEVIPFQKFNQIEIGDEFIYFTNKKELFRMNLRSKEILKINLKTPVDYFSTNTRHLFVLNDKVVYLYDSQIKS
ncbi:hypothetical protein [Moheibacter sediminis]|uniref:Uncharacterized protein n=1 Tax=Moheibacter sediminis TaxID=1434700 RepID=A0A1W2C1T0_9FLAO|nr:hypothetical protein [Moheibacter sediminis]SMC79051.1 hypothetical protein SAMN06296427_10860 [Moheibacter sediminis]